LGVLLFKNGQVVFGFLDDSPWIRGIWERGKGCKIVGDGDGSIADGMGEFRKGLGRRGGQSCFLAWAGGDVVYKSSLNSYFLTPI
jgi:hypothetical protein